MLISNYTPFFTHPAQRATHVPCPWHLFPITSVDPCSVSIAATCQLTNDQARYAIDVAEGRKRNNLDAHIRDLKTNKLRSAIDVDLQGILGEMAFAQLFGLKHGLEDVRPRGVNNDSFDCIILPFTNGNNQDSYVYGFDDQSLSGTSSSGNKLQKKGYTCDIKTCFVQHLSCEDYPLKVHEHKKRNMADVYTLLMYTNGYHNHQISIRDMIECFHHEPQFSFRGFILGKDLFQDQNRKLFHDGWFYHVPQHKLKTWSELKVYDCCMYIVLLFI